MPTPDAIPILGIPVHAVTMADTLALVEGYMAEPRLHQIATVNPEFVMAAQSDAEFRRVLREADLCLPDGVGLLYAARRSGQRLPERVPGSELVYRLAERAAARGWPLFLLGAAIAYWTLPAAIGFLFGPLKMFERIFAATAAFMLVAAIPLTDEIGFAMCAVFLLWHWLRRRATAPAPT